MSEIKRLSAEACEVLWGIISDYMERHGNGGNGGEADSDRLAMRLLAASVELADRQRSRRTQAARLREDELPGRDTTGTAEPERQLRRDGTPLSQEDILRELIAAYKDDPEIVARLEEFIGKYLNL